MLTLFASSFSDKAVDEMKRALEEKELITNENDRLEVLAQCLSRINLVATKGSHCLGIL